MLYGERRSKPPSPSASRPTTIRDRDAGRRGSARRIGAWFSAQISSSAAIEGSGSLIEAMACGVMPCGTSIPARARSPVVTALWTVGDPDARRRRRRPAARDRVANARDSAALRRRAQLGAHRPAQRPQYRASSRRGEIGWRDEDRHRPHRRPASQRAREVIPAWLWLINGWRRSRCPRVHRHLLPPRVLLAAARPRPSARPMGAVEARGRTRTRGNTREYWVTRGHSPRWQDAVCGPEHRHLRQRRSSCHSRASSMAAAKSVGHALVQLACRLATRFTRQRSCLARQCGADQDSDGRRPGARLGITNAANRRT